MFLFFLFHLFTDIIIIMSTIKVIVFSSYVFKYTSVLLRVRSVGGLVTGRVF